MAYYYIVTAIERFEVRTEYVVSAESAEEAEKKCREGDVPYDEYDFTENDEWVRTESVEKV